MARELEERPGVAAHTAFEVFRLDGRSRGNDRRFFFDRFDFFVGTFGAFAGKTDFAFVDVDAQNHHFDFFVDFNDVFRIFHFVVGEFRNVKETFEVVFQADENAEVGDLRNFTGNDLVRLVFFRNAGNPRVFRKLFQTERDTTVFLVDRGNDAFDFVVLADDFARMRDLANPAHIADVKQTVDAFFDFDESAVVGEVANDALDAHTDRVFLIDRFPRVARRLFDAEGNFLFFLVDAEDNDVDFLPLRKDFVRVIDAFRPGHFADVDEAFDAFFQLNERAVGHDVDDDALDFRADRVFLFDVFPRARGLLFQTERNLFLFVIDLKNHNFDLLIDFDEFFRVGDAAPAHVRDVEQTVDAAQVDERAEFGDVLDRAFANLADFEFVEQRGFLFGAFLFDESATADDDVATGFVDLENDALDRLVDEFADVGRTTNVDLAGREENVDADIDEKTALDLLRNFTVDDVAFLDALHHIVPGFDLRGLALAQNDHTARGNVFAGHRVFEFFDENFHFVARFRSFFVFFPFRNGDGAFALIPDVDDDEFFFDANDGSFDELIQRNFGVGAVIRENVFFENDVFDVFVQTANQSTINHYKIPKLVKSFTG